MLKHIGNISHNFLKERVDGNFVKFKGNFSMKVRKIVRILQIILQKLRRNPEEILKIFGAPLKICAAALQSLIQYCLQILSKFLDCASSCPDYSF